MKNILIIQRDEAYFLFETIQVLEKYSHHFKNFNITLLVNEKSLNQVYDNSSPIIRGITWDESKVLETAYDHSVNLSMEEETSDFHGRINSSKKVGPYRKDDQLIVNDLWSTYLITLKAKAPFLTFHLQDIYRNILGLKELKLREHSKTSIKQIAFALTSPEIFPASEQEALINTISQENPHTVVLDATEVDDIADLSQTLYIGPAGLKALKICENGGTAILLTGSFQGFNYLPNSDKSLVVSSRNQQFSSSEVNKLVSKVIKHEVPLESSYSLYQTDCTVFSGTYLKSLNTTDNNYPFYQAHVVLWNFLLNLSDINLEVTKCNLSQINLLKNNQEVLRKYIRLHEYAMASIDIIYRESKAAQSNPDVIDGHLKNLREINQLANQVAESHSFLRPVLDFYHIRHAQNQGADLIQQSKESLLSYSEEHQVLEALLELFSVTIKQNDVSI